MNGSRSAERQAALAAGIAAALALAACAPAPGRPAPRRVTLAGVVDSVVSTPPLDRTHWGIEVHDPARGATLFALDPERHFVPASNMKLLVTAVALGELGPEFRYRTELYARRAPGDTAAALLVVAGRGDPTWSERFHGTPWAPLDSLADSVALAGIARVTGELVVDASHFDREFIHPTWEVGDLDYGYAAPVAAFAIEEGTFRSVVSPGAAAGEPARVTVLAPPGTITLVNRLVTDTAGARRRIEVSRTVGSDTVTLLGTIPLGAAPDTLRLAVGEPARYAARALAAALEARGIEIEGGVRVVYDTLEAAVLRGVMDTAAVAPTAADSALADTTAGGTAAVRLERVASWTSPPLAEVVAAILKPSQNWIAEMLLKTLGAERGEGGSWPAGAEVERRYLFDVVGIDSTAIVVRDGSGLSAQNLVTPRALVQLLAHARRMPWGPAYRAALAVPGEEEGTLENRLRGLEGRLYAKTGTITHVNSLTGYLTTASGRELIFSILTNASGQPSGEVRRAIDGIARTIAEQGGAR
ncbi:MAG TPA: D-alanyl-D-alanine carboxypeptidase/D-alanyl-D-alanine-endopeptidase [Longimicrobiales bacterium]